MQDLFLILRTWVLSAGNTIPAGISKHFAKPPTIEIGERCQCGLFSGKNFSCCALRFRAEGLSLS